MALQQPSMGPLSEYLERIKTLRSYWGLDDDLERKGEAESLWFRGHRSLDWKLVPKLNRSEFKGADENADFLMLNARAWTHRAHNMRTGSGSLERKRALHAPRGPAVP